MTLRECVDRLRAEVICGEECLDHPVTAVCASDLLSDVLGTNKHNFLLITGLATAQVVRTAELLGCVGVVFVRGKYPPQEAIGMANVHGIPLLCTRVDLFESCCCLANLGLEQAPE